MLYGEAQWRRIPTIDYTIVKLKGLAENMRRFYISEFEPITNVKFKNDIGRYLILALLSVYHYPMKGWQLLNKKVMSQCKLNVCACTVIETNCFSMICNLARGH